MNNDSGFLKVEFIHLPVINFALQQNRVSIIRFFSVENTSDKILENIQIKLDMEPEFAHVVTYNIESIFPGEIIKINNLSINLSTNFFIQITERMAGNMSLIITAEQLQLYQADFLVDILAFDQWTGTSVLPEMLSAFITPNHPVINLIQNRAAVILEQLTGSPSFNEYQSRNPNRVKAQMAAIYNAIAEQQIIYSAVPASFEETGQRVRLADNVIAQKTGNCLDMALLYASCLEAIGLHPLIVITRGHAFGGAWLIPDTFPDSVIDDNAYLTKRTAEGINEILLVEATCMNKGNDCEFDRAVKIANDNLKKTSEFILALDVKRSRFSGIRPLPQRILNGGHWEITGEEVTVKEKEIIAPESVNPYDLSNLSTSVQVTKQLMWERKLLDLSLRNNLLNIRITKNTLQLISADLDKFEDALADGSEFRLLPKPNDWNNPLYNFGLYNSLVSTDPIIELIKSEVSQKRLRTYLPETELDKALKHLYRSSRLSIEENGANTLYLAIGLLRWYETPTSERPRYAPILLLPVEMVRKSAAKGYIIRSREEDSLLNITLVEMLRQNFGINVPGLDPLPTDGSGVNVRLIYSIFRNSIKNQPKWDVEEQAILGIFSFNKFIMWNDIHNNSRKLLSNKLVSSLVNGKIEFEVDNECVDAAELEKTMTPADIVLPISADSSQLEAVYEAINDKTYILHGPPGTGKSQTITNIISNALYKGKRVLFVAEKMAALSVVQSRLEAIGLSPFCLELHSNKAKKTGVLSQLKTTTEVAKQQSPESFSREANRLFELRKELNKYIEALHKSYPFGISLYEAITRYTLLDVESEINFSSTLFPTLTGQQIREWQDIVDLLVSIGNACGHPNNHPLAGINIPEYTPELKEKVKIALTEIIQILTRLKACSSAIHSLTGDTNEASYTKSQTDSADGLFSLLLRIPELTPELLEQLNPNETLAECGDIVNHGKERDKYKTFIMQYFTEDILAVNAKVLLNTWHIAEGKWFIPKYFGKKKVYQQLAMYIHNGSIKKLDIRTILTAIIKYQDEQRYVASYADTLSTLFGKYAKPETEQWNKIETIIEDFLSFDTLLLNFTKDIPTAVCVKQTLSRNVINGVDSFRKIHYNRIMEFKNAVSQLTDATFNISEMLGIDNNTFYNNTPNWIDDALTQLNCYVGSIEKLKDWYQWLAANRKAVQLGIGFVAEEYNVRNIPTNWLKDSFNKGFYHAVINYIIANEPNLNLFKGKLFEDVILKYQELTDAFQDITKKELYAKLAANIPNFTVEAVRNSEVGILQRNIKNNARGTSLRSLFDQIPTLLSRMCPCMLMSPISVAQYINPDADKFDLIVFDEASQMPTYEAVGAIARGNNMIIVGDPKQMPPTNFFSVNTVDEDNLDKEDLESILDDSLALSIPSRYLLWHYRSKHESLIAFSNSEYYDNKLLTFPSPDNIESKVRLVRIEGFYDKGKSRQNKQEAQAVVNEIERRLSSETLRKRSIGVVTFSSVQQMLIEDLLSDLYLFRPDLETIALEGEEPLFIKNLENVQGDERDVILFSVGYGPDAEGRVSMNFGPLNRVGGERRLNVAVSRARYEMMIFSTLRSDQIDLNKTSAVGVSGLKRFLEYAEKGGLINRANQVNLNNKISIEHDIARKLEASGYQVHTNIGTSGYKIDIGVVDAHNPNRYVLGILCDGENYRQTKTARDREIVQSGVLRMLGWNICRVWTLDWWENPLEVLEMIKREIEKAKLKKKEEPAVVHKTQEVITENVLPVQEPQKEEKLFDKYICAYLPSVPYSSDAFLSAENSRYITNQIKKIIETEAPITRSLLCKRILQSWGIARLGARVEAHLDQLFNGVECYIKKDGDFIVFWKSEEHMRSYSTFRPVSERSALDLPPDEIANAVKHVLESQISLPTTDLSRVTAQLFGFARTGNNVDHAIHEGIREAKNRSYIRIDNGRAVIV